MIYILLYFLSFCFWGCSTTPRLYTIENIKTNNVIHISVDSFDSLVVSCLEKPTNLNDTTKVLRMIRVSNTLENIYFSFRRNEFFLAKPMYAKLLDKYYGEFHQLLSINKNFIAIPQKEYHDLYRNDKSMKIYITNDQIIDDMLKKRPQQQFWYYKTRKVVLMPNQNNSISYFVN
jgi:hypothetical protein